MRCGGWLSFASLHHADHAFVAGITGLDSGLSFALNWAPTGHPHGSCFLPVKMRRRSSRATSFTSMMSDEAKAQLASVMGGLNSLDTPPPRPKNSCFPMAAGDTDDDNAEPRHKVWLDTEPPAKVRLACLRDKKALKICDDLYCGGEGCKYPEKRKTLNGCDKEVEDTKGNATPASAAAEPGSTAASSGGDANVGSAGSYASVGAVAAAGKAFALRPSGPPEPRIPFDVGRFVTGNPDPKMTDRHGGPAMQPLGTNTTAVLGSFVPDVLVLAQVLSNRVPRRPYSGCRASCYPLQARKWRSQAPEEGVRLVVGTSFL